jgi:RNA polymerase sigma factor (sigma-70 family)
MDSMSLRPDAHPDVPAGRAASLTERAALTVALLGAALGVALPGLSILWLLAAAVTTGVASEALDRTGGLAPTTFGGGYWLAMGLDVAVVLWSVMRRLRGRPGPWKPLVGLVTAYVLLIWLAVVPDLSGAVDVPDVVTTFVLLGADALVSYVFPCMLLALLVRGSAHLWRLGSASSAAAQRIGVAAACLALACLTLGAGVAAVDVEPRSVREALAELETSLEVDGVEGERRTYAALSLGLGSGSGSASDLAPAPEARSAFDDCAESLAGSQASADPVIERAMISLIRDGVGKADAEDLAMDALLSVCSKHAKQRLEDVVTYYWKTLRNKATRSWHRRQRELTGWEDDLFTASQGIYADEQLSPDEALLVKAVKDQLDPEQWLVLHLRHEQGMSYAEIAKSLDMSEAAARQRAKRARDQAERLLRQ